MNATVIEPPKSQAQDLDQVALLNEVIQKRQEEASQLQMQLENLRARLVSEKAQWVHQKNDEETAFRRRVEELEQAYQQRLNQVDKDVTQVNLSLQNQRMLEQAAEQKVIEAQARLAELDIVSEERLKLQQVKLALDDRSRGLEERWAEANRLQERGQEALTSSERLVADVQQRTLALNEREADLKRREDTVVLRKSQLDGVEHALEQRLKALSSPAPSTESTPVPSVPVATDTQASEGSVNA